MKLTFRAYAKINLLLDVVGRLPNGYHSVVMLNQSIGLYDTVTVETTPGKPIEIVCDVTGIPLDERNICWKACKAYGLYSGVKITLKKRIPSEAGLAGGSSNAAAVLTALHAMFPDLTSNSLYNVAARVGADVPFCLMGGCCLGEGIGEKLTPLPCLPDEYSIALTKPALSVSTGAAYTLMDRIDLIHPQTEQAVALAKRGDWAGALPLCANVFEQVVDLPGLARAKQAALQSGASLAQMTGSGSAVFAVYRDNIANEGILRALGAWGEDVRIYKPVPFGIEQV